MVKYRQRAAAFLIIGLLLTNFTNAQVSVHAASGDAVGSGGTVAYSVGQVVYTTHSGNSGHIAQGVQHAYEIFILGVTETELLQSISVFPNPATEILNLAINDYGEKKIKYQLFDVQGKLLNSERILVQQTQINMSDLPAAVYFLNIVNQHNKTIQSFKIVKN